MVVLRRRADHAGTLRHGDLHRERPHTAGGGMYQNGVTLADVKAMDERLVCGQAGKRNCRRLSETHVRRLTGQGPDGCADLFGVRASPDSIFAHVAEHLIADSELSYRRANLLHDAGDVPAGGDGKEDIKRAIETARGQLPVDGIDRGRAHRDLDPVGPDLRLVDLAELECFGAAIGPILDCLHRSLLANRVRLTVSYPVKTPETIGRRPLSPRAGVHPLRTR